MMDPKMRELMEKHPHPEITLAELVNKKLKTSISPERMRRFMRANWKAVSLLAHLLHEKQHRTDERKKLKPQPQ